MSSLYDFAFREHSPSQGRWISPDPLGMGATDLSTPQSWNRYAYVANGPLNAVDPLGLNRAGPGQCEGGEGLCPWEGGGENPEYLGGGGGGFCDAGGDCYGQSFEQAVQNFMLGEGGFPDDGGWPIFNYHGDSGGYLVGDYPGEVFCPPGFACNQWDPFSGKWQPYNPPPDIRVAHAKSVKQLFKARTSECYNGFHQTTTGKAIQAFSAIALFPVANNYGDNLLALGGEVAYKFSMAAGSNAAGRVFTPILEAFTAEVTTPLFVLGTGLDGAALLTCSADAALSIAPH